MGELSFIPATRAAGLITSSGKVLCNVTLGAFAQRETKQVALSDNIQNYDVIFANAHCGTYISGNSQDVSFYTPSYDGGKESLFTQYASHNAFTILSKIPGGTYIGVEYSHNSLSYAAPYLQGSIVNILSFSALNAGTSLTIYGLKLG